MGGQRTGTESLCNTTLQATRYQPSPLSTHAQYARLQWPTQAHHPSCWPHHPRSAPRGSGQWGRCVCTRPVQLSTPDVLQWQRGRGIQWTDAREGVWSQGWRVVMHLYSLFYSVSLTYVLWMGRKYIRVTRSRLEEWAVAKHYKILSHVVSEYKKATIHQTTNMLSTSKMSYFEVITTC